MRELSSALSRCSSLRERREPQSFAVVCGGVVLIR